MIGIDTNILLRLFLQDDIEQGKLATEFFRRLPETGPGYISCLTLLEFTWFLRRSIKLTREQIMEGVNDLLESQDLVLEDEAAIEEALGVMQSSREEFADVLIAVRNRKAGCRTTMTFDVNAAQRIPGMELLA